MPSKIAITEKGLNKVSRIYSEAGGNMGFKKNFKIRVPAPIKRSQIFILGIFINFFRFIINYIKAPGISVYLLVDFNPPPEVDFISASGTRKGIIKFKVRAKAKVKINNSVSWNLLALEADIEVTPIVVFSSVIFKHTAVDKIQFKITNNILPSTQSKYLKNIVNGVLSLSQSYIDNLLKISAIYNYQFQVLNKSVAFASKVSNIEILKDKIEIAININ